MVEEFGTSELVGPLALTRPPAFILPDGWPREPSSEAKAEIRGLLEEAERRATAILREQRQDLEWTARVLIARETLERAELDNVLAESRRARDRRPERSPAIARSGRRGAEQWPLRVPATPSLGWPRVFPGRRGSMRRS